MPAKAKMPDKSFCVLPTKVKNVCKLRWCLLVFFPARCCWAKCTQRVYGININLTVAVSGQRLNAATRLRGLSALCLMSSPAAQWKCMKEKNAAPFKSGFCWRSSFDTQRVRIFGYDVIFTNDLTRTTWHCGGLVLAYRNKHWLGYQVCQRVSLKRNRLSVPLLFFLW